MIQPHLVVTNVCQAARAQLALNGNAATLCPSHTAVQHLVRWWCIPKTLVAPQAATDAGVSRWPGIEAAPQHSVGVGALECKGTHTSGRQEARLLEQRLQHSCSCLPQDVRRQLAGGPQLSQRADHIRVDCCQSCDGVAALGSQLCVRMHHTNAACRRLRVAITRLGGTEAQRQAATPQHCGGSTNFNGVAQGSACKEGWAKNRFNSVLSSSKAHINHPFYQGGGNVPPTSAVHLQGADVARDEASGLQCAPDHALLRRAVGRGQAAAAAILVHKRAMQHNATRAHERGWRGWVKGSQAEHDAGLSPHVAIGRGIQGLAATVKREHACGWAGRSGTGDFVLRIMHGRPCWLVNQDDAPMQSRVYMTLTSCLSRGGGALSEHQVHSR